MNQTTERAKKILEDYDGPQCRIMEVCGTHTHEIFRQGIRKILPDRVRLISGPGCPVCVTPVGFIDEAVRLALERHVTICTFGDLVRVPGTAESLQTARGRGARVKVVYTPLDAADYATGHPVEQVVFLSVGFETTTPACCLAVREAGRRGLTNFSLLTANKTMPGAYRAMKDSADLFLYPGHVHAVTGTQVCEELMREGISGVCAGFTAEEILTALAVAVTHFREGRPFFVNCYPRVVTRQGSPKARTLMEEMMEPCDSVWRGIGTIPGSGLRLRDAYSAFDARRKYGMPETEGRENPACRCGQVLKGEILPARCPVFGKGCTPEHPVGACMVSSEGACSAWYQYGRE